MELLNPQVTLHHTVVPNITKCQDSLLRYGTQAWEPLDFPPRWRMEASRETRSLRLCCRSRNCLRRSKRDRRRSSVRRTAFSFSRATRPPASTFFAAGSATLTMTSPTARPFCRIPVSPASFSDYPASSATSLTRSPRSPQRGRARLRESRRFLQIDAQRIPSLSLSVLSVLAAEVRAARTVHVGILIVRCYPRAASLCLIYLAQPMH